MEDRPRSERRSYPTGKLESRPGSLRIPTAFGEHSREPSKDNRDSQTLPDNGQQKSPTAYIPSTTSFVSELLQVFQNVPSEILKKRSFPDPDMGGYSGYSGMHESTVSERSLAFKTNRESLIPTLRLEEKGKRILREEWIKNNSPNSSPHKSKSSSPKPVHDNTVNIISEYEDESRSKGGNRKSMSLSQAR